MLDKCFAYFLNYLHFIEEEAEWLSISFRVTKLVSAGLEFRPDAPHSRALRLTCDPLLLSAGHVVALHPCAERHGFYLGLQLVPAE